MVVGRAGGGYDVGSRIVVYIRTIDVPGFARS